NGHDWLLRGDDELHARVWSGCQCGRPPPPCQPADGVTPPDQLSPYTSRSSSSPSWIICARRERWILPLDVFGIVLDRTRMTRAGRWPCALWTRLVISRTRL